MQEEFDEVLIRITFHSSKVHKLMLDIPYNAKEKLSVKLDQEQVLFLPFNELVQVFSQSESALINLAPLV